MSKPEWGAKRTCNNCGTRFYDLMRAPIICPKCGATVEPEVHVKSRRSAPVEKAAPVVAAVIDEVLDVEVADEELEAVEDDDADEVEAAEEDEALIEDTSDLGEDDDDMAEVIDHMDEGMEDEV